MAKVPNLLLRQGTYYLRREIPADLRSAYAPKKAIWHSLHTKNKAEAIKRLHERMAQLNDEFARRRLDLRAQSEEQEYVQSTRFAAALGKVSDNLNEFGLGAPQYKFDTADPVEQAFQEKLGYVDRPKSRREALELVEEALAQLSSDAEYDLSRGRMPDGEPIWGIPDRYVDRVSAFIDELIEADRRSLLAIQAEIEGREDDTIQLTTERSLASLVEVWRRERQPAKSSQHDMQTSVTLFERVNGPLPCTDITVEHGRKFKEAVIALPRASATKRRLWGMLKALLNVAKGNAFITANPLDSFTLQLKDDSSRRGIFTPSELKQLLTILEGDELWITRIGLYTGARLAEICQLQREDVKEIEGVWHFDIHADAAMGRRVKNKNSSRLVPVHKQLIADGFMERLESKNGRIFSLTPRAASKRLNRRISEAKIGDDSKVFHSLRHTFKTAARRVMEQEFHDKLTGHASQSVGQRYGEYLDLKEKIDKVQFGIES